MAKAKTGQQAIVEQIVDLCSELDLAVMCDLCYGLYLQGRGRMRIYKAVKGAGACVK